MITINANGMALTPALASVLVEEGLSRGLIKSDMYWRVGLSAACAIQILFMICEPDGVARTQAEIRHYLEHGDDLRTFLGIKTLMARGFRGIRLECHGSGPAIGEITNLAIPSAVYGMTDREE